MSKFNHIIGRKNLDYYLHVFNFSTVFFLVFGFSFPSLCAHLLHINSNDIKNKCHLKHYILSHMFTFDQITICGINHLIALQLVVEQVIAKTSQLLYFILNYFSVISLTHGFLNY